MKLHLPATLVLVASAAGMLAGHLAADPLRRGATLEQRCKPAARGAAGRCDNGLVPTRK